MLPLAEAGADMVAQQTDLGGDLLKELIGSRVVVAWGPYNAPHTMLDASCVLP